MAFARKCASHVSRQGTTAQTTPKPQSETTPLIIHSIFPHFESYILGRVEFCREPESFLTGGKRKDAQNTTRNTNTNKNNSNNNNSNNNSNSNSYNNSNSNNHSNSFLPEESQSFLHPLFPEFTFDLRSPCHVSNV